MSWPRVEREPVNLPSLPALDDALWDTLVELCEVRPGEWTLIGGQMVFLHALEHDTTPPRVSTDLDILVNARVTSGAIAAFAVAIEALGFELAGMGPEGIAHRYQRGTLTVDVLAPDGLGPRTDLTTTVPGRTLQVPGGTQALERTELVPVATTTRTGHVPRPSLLGAIVDQSGRGPRGRRPRGATTGSGVSAQPGHGSIRATGTARSDGPTSAPDESGAARRRSPRLAPGRTGGP